MLQFFISAQAQLVISSLPRDLLLVITLYMDSIEKKLQQKLLKVPVPPDAIGFYQPVNVVDKIAYVSGQLPLVDNALINYRGRLGKEINIENGQRAAKTCILNALGQLKKTIGSLDKIKRIVKITGFVNSLPGFKDQAKVMDGASELLVELWGEDGKHARSSVGVVELPLGACIEIEMQVLLK